MNIRHKWLAGLMVLGLVLSRNSIGGKADVLPPMPVSSDPRPQVTLADDGLVLDWRAPDAQIVPRGDGTVGVAMAGYGLTDEPGLPQLPFASALIALPPDAAPTLQVLLSDEQDLSIGGPLPLAPRPEGVVRDASGHPVGVAFAPVQEGQAVDQRTSAARLEPVGVARGVRLARVVFYPVRAAGEPFGTRVRVTTRLRVSIAFNAPALRSTRPLSAPLDPLVAVIQSAVVNPDQVSSARPAASDTRAWLGIPNPKIAIEVSAPGLTAITCEALSASGFPADSANPHYIHLARNGVEIALEWDGNDNESCEPGERFLFYADPRASRWTTTDVYFLWLDATPGLRMSSRSAAPASQPSGLAWMDATAEVNAIYTPDCFCETPAGRDGDRWMWDELIYPGYSAGSYQIKLPVSVDVTQPATLTVWLAGKTDLSANPDHRVDVSLNSRPLGRVEWDGKQAVTATLTVAPGVLHGNLNTLTLTLPGLPGVIGETEWLDAFSVHYARGSAAMGGSATFTGQTTPHAYTLALTSTVGLRAYDVTDPDHPVRLTDVAIAGNSITLGDPPTGGPHRYDLMSESDLANPRYRSVSTLPAVMGADYIIITPDEFAPALSSLISLRQSQGLSVTVASPQAIYDDARWGDGRLDPQAIRAFIANAYATWNPKPTYVLLVGDGSFDPKLYWSSSTPTFIPPYLANVDPLGESAADNRYVTVDGNDNLPDLAIGRLPVKTLAETQAVVNKIVQYETNPFPGDWIRQVTLVADDADTGWSYANESDTGALPYLTPPMVATRRYCAGVSLEDSDCSDQDAAAIHTQLLNDWNRGVLIMQYTGHSSWQQWALERFFHLDDLPSLHNSRRWPIVLEMTCFTGAFQRPEPTLDEDLVVRSDAGAIAAWGGTTTGSTLGHEELASGFYRAVFRDTVATIGEATYAGKFQVVYSGYMNVLDLVDTFVLLGDPATRFDRTVVPWANQVYLPAVLRNSP